MYKNMDKKMYLCIDLKSFYASVECVERGLDPMTTNLVVADLSRTEKTICLAVSPSLKAYGISGRARLFEVEQKVEELNRQRLANAAGGVFSGESADTVELKKDSRLKLAYIAAPPRMGHYIEFSTKIYDIYLRFVAPEDIHIYSIDEVFIDISAYLKINKTTPRAFAEKMTKAVVNEMGITATAGLGENMYLAKVAMDILSKQARPNDDGVSIAELDEMSYRRRLWGHRPITDFWRVGRGYADRLASAGLYTMGDIARCSLGGSSDYYNEDLLYKMFGINAELLIDHAWGREPCTMKEVKAYRPLVKSLSSGQVLHCPYDYEKARIIVKEMAQQLCLELIEKKSVTNRLSLTVVYDRMNLIGDNAEKKYKGETESDRYGRKLPKHGHATVRLERFTSSAADICGEFMRLYDKAADPRLLIRKIVVGADNLISEKKASTDKYEQIDFFSTAGSDNSDEIKDEKRDKERRLQEAILDIKKRYGKNAALKGLNFREGATAKDRNRQIGGHRE